MTTRSYDHLNRLTEIANQPYTGGGAGTAAGLPLSYAYAYNAANQRTQMTLADGSYWMYQYDATRSAR